jgi:hypothetical protein
MNRGVRVKLKPSIFISLEIEKTKFNFDFSEFYTERYGIDFPDLRVQKKISIRFGFKKSEKSNYLLISGKDAMSIFQEIKAFLKIANKVCEKVVFQDFRTLLKIVRKEYKRNYLEAYQKGFTSAEIFGIGKMQDEFNELSERMHSELSDLYFRAKCPEFRSKLKNMDTYGRSYYNLLPTTQEGLESWKVMSDIFSLHGKIKSLISEKTD